MTSQSPLPGYHPQPGSPLGPQLHRLSRVSKVLISVLIGTMVTSLSSGIASLVRAGRIDASIDGEGDIASLDSADTLVGVISIADLLVYIAAGVYFMVWSWRVLKNARAIAPEYAPAPGWAIGAWFIPVANFVLPGYFLNRADRLSGSTTRRAKSLIISWAVVFWFAITLERVIWRSTSETLDGIRASDQRDMWARLLLVAAAVLAVMVVRAVTARQERALLARHESYVASLAASEARRLRGPPAGFSAPIDPTGGVDARPDAGPPPRNEGPTAAGSTG